MSKLNVPRAGNSRCSYRTRSDKVSVEMPAEDMKKVRKYAFDHDLTLMEFFRRAARSYLESLEGKSRDSLRVSESDMLKLTDLDEVEPYTEKDYMEGGS